MPTADNASCGPRAWLLSFAILLVSAAPAFAQPEGAALEGKTVKRIDFVGLERLTKQGVMARMQTQEGRPFIRKALEDDLRMLAGHVKRVQPAPVDPTKPPEPPPLPPKVFSVIPSIRAVLEDGAVIVTITALENRRVAGLVFLGAVAYGRDDLLPHIRTRDGNPIDDFILELDRQEIERYYRERGHHYVEVQFVKTTQAAGDLIAFRVTEGPEVDIRRVEFRGAKAFDTGELMEQMPFTAEPGFFSSKEFIYEQVKRDVVQLEAFYRGKGYSDARVVLLEPIPSADHEKMDLVFHVEEGEPYTVRSVRIDGLTLFDPDEMMREMRTRPGGVYEPGFDLRLDVRDIEGHLHEFGYTTAQVQDVSTFGRAENSVDVVLSVREGKLVLVGDIRIQGNVETQDRVIRREIELYTGEPLNLKKLRRSRNRIRALGYWMPPRGSRLDTPEIPFQSYQIYRDAYLSLRDTGQSNIKDIVVEVEEQDTGSLRFAAGVGSNTGILGDITYTKANFDLLDWPEGFDDILDAFTGGGQLLVLSVQPGTIYSRWRAAWTNPRVMDGPFSLSTEVYQSQWRRKDWDEERLGYGVRVGRRLGDDLSVTLGLRDEIVDVNRIENDAPQLVFDFEGENQVTSLTLDLRLNRLNDFVNPTDGYLLQSSIEHAGFWGDVQFNKALVRGDYYFEAYEDSAEQLHVVRFRGQLGWASEQGDTHDIPVYERFYAGGAGSLRGFRFRGVGPMDNGDPIGGKALWIAGTEYGFPLFGDNLRGVAFVDTGSVSLDWSDPGIFDVRVSVGVGVRLVIPFLSANRPLAIDFGVPIIKHGEDETQFISFSFGSR
ncbi:MAG: BamA/TamA family outer membrane protein [Planctomycetota bacterium]|nr:BamA/TamA family outer membrane protein [Planctomycetota bacterium]